MGLPQTELVPFRPPAPHLPDMCHNAFPDARQPPPYEHLKPPISVLPNRWSTVTVVHVVPRSRIKLHIAESPPARPAVVRRGLPIVVEKHVKSANKDLQPPVSVPTHCRRAGPCPAEGAPARPTVV